jgi:hypothetical protein
MPTRTRGVFNSSMGNISRFLDCSKSQFHLNALQDLEDGDDINKITNFLN